MSTESTATKGYGHWNVENTYEGCQLAVLVAIRDELRKLNLLLHCQNFTGIPHTLKAIERQTKKPRRKRVRSAS